MNTMMLAVLSWVLSMESIYGNFICIISVSPHIKSERWLFQPLLLWMRKQHTSERWVNLPKAQRWLSYLHQGVKAVFALSKLFSLQFRVVLYPAPSCLAKGNSTSALHEVTKITGFRHRSKRSWHPSNMALSKLLNLSEPQFPHLQNKDSSIFLTVLQ